MYRRILPLLLALLLLSACTAPSGPAVTLERKAVKPLAPDVMLNALSLRFDHLAAWRSSLR